ncbi:MAG: dihydroorotase, partial [Bacteroidota bacterium]|nr:dihydroorotase [Bacteroidota bacterium]
MRTLIKDAKLVNEGDIYQSDVLIEHQKIKKIAPKIVIETDQIIDAEGLHLLPGVIDDQ